MNRKDETTLDRILQILHEIAEISAGGNYIYRGEAKSHPKTCSGLYRPYAKSEIQDPDVMGSQELILKKLKEYLPEMDGMKPFDILAQLQHYGAATNLIDFTTDCLVALFFACEKEDTEDGRVLLLENTNDKDYQIIKAHRTIDRVESQKSLFVLSTKGFIVPDHIVNIPFDLKPFIRTYLKENHDITEVRVYNDIHGFIKSAATAAHRLEFHKAAPVREKWEELHLKSERQKLTHEEQQTLHGAFKMLLHHYGMALKMNDDFLEAYLDLAQIYFLKHDYDSSIKYYSEAIKLRPQKRRILLL